MAPRTRGRARARARARRQCEDERMEEVLRHFRIEKLDFDEEVIKTVAKKILKEYDVGEDKDGAWCLITQNNYQILIQQILEYQENNKPESSYGDELLIEQILESEENYLLEGSCGAGKVIMDKPASSSAAGNKARARQRRKAIGIRIQEPSEDENEQSRKRKEKEELVDGKGKKKIEIDD